MSRPNNNNNNVSFNADFLMSLRKQNSSDLSELSMIANESQFNSNINISNNNNNNSDLLEPINYNLVNCFNNELLTLGYPSNLNGDDRIAADLNGMFRHGLDLIDRFNRQLTATQRVKEE